MLREAYGMPHKAGGAVLPCFSSALWRATGVADPTRQQEERTVSAVSGDARLALRHTLSLHYPGLLVHEARDGDRAGIRERPRLPC